MSLQLLLSIPYFRRALLPGRTYYFLTTGVSLPVAFIFSWSRSRSPPEHVSLPTGRDWFTSYTGIFFSFLPKKK